MAHLICEWPNKETKREEWIWVLHILSRHPGESRFECVVNGKGLLVFKSYQVSIIFLNMLFSTGSKDLCWITSHFPYFYNDQQMHYSHKGDRSWNSDEVELNTPGIDRGSPSEGRKQMHRSLEGENYASITKSTRTQ